MDTELNTIEKTVEWLERENTREYMDKRAESEKRYKIFMLKWTNHRAVKVFVNESNKILTQRKW
jgi:hypothetical protein